MNIQTLVVVVLIFILAKCNKIARLPTKLNLIPVNELEKEIAKDGYIWYFVPFTINMIRNKEYVRFELVFTPSKGQPRTIAHVKAEWVSTLHQGTPSYGGNQPV